MTRLLDRLLDSVICIGVLVVSMVMGWALIGVAVGLVLR